MNDDSNPYQAPAAEVTLIQESVPMEIASKGRRFGTLIVDYATFLGISFVIGIVVAVVFGEAGIKWIDQIPDRLLGIFIMLGYYLTCEGIWGRTLGKLVFGTIVVDETGQRPTFGKIFKRTLCRFIPFEPFSCLGERGWHDSIPGVRVVLSRR